MTEVMFKNSKLAKDILVIIFASMTSFLTAVFLSIAENGGFIIYSFMVFMFVPLGAIGGGFVGALGYYFGAKLLSHKPSRILLYSVPLLSISTYILINYLNYAMLYVEHVPLRVSMSFLKYLDFRIQKTSLSLVGVGHSFTGEMGFLGYAVALIQILGFSLGGYGAYFWLSREPFCDNCGRYRSLKWEGSRYFSDEEIFEAHYREMTNCFEGWRKTNNLNALEENVKKYAEEASMVPEKKCDWSSQLKLKYCKKCLRHYVKFVIEKRVTDDRWSVVSESEYEASAEK